MTVRKVRSVFWVCFAVWLLAVGLVPAFVTSEYIIRFVALVLFWIGMAGCWNLMCGYTGYIDFGPVVYFGIGSYCTAIMMTRFGAGFLPSLAVSALTAGLISLPIGLTALRLRGAYFAIATFAFAETMKQVVTEFDRTLGVTFFEGGHGITLPIPGTGNALFLYCALSVTACVMVLHYWVETSKFGLGLKAIQQAEDAAETSGVDTTTMKLRAYVLMALLLGVFGGIEAYWVTYITPGDAFNVQKSVQMVIMSLLGGMGTLLGPAVGATLLTVIYEVLGVAFVEYYLIMVGAIIIAIILAMPRGIVGTVKQRLGLGFI